MERISFTLTRTAIISISVSSALFYPNYDFSDLNHILHACSHGLGLTPDDGPLSGIFGHIEKYIDKLIEVAMPRKLCLLAVDGVAPKAKLMQQRTRRFLGAHRKKLESQFGLSRIAFALQIIFQDKKLSTRWKDCPTKNLKIHQALIKILSRRCRFSSNNRNLIVSKGTPFMRQLSSLLHEYVDKRLKYSKEWKNLKVRSKNNPNDSKCDFRGYFVDSE